MNKMTYEERKVFLKQLRAAKPPLISREQAERLMELSFSEDARVDELASHLMPNDLPQFVQRRALDKGLARLHPAEGKEYDRMDAMRYAWFGMDDRVPIIIWATP